MLLGRALACQSPVMDIAWTTPICTADDAGNKAQNRADGHRPGRCSHVMAAAMTMGSGRISQNPLHGLDQWTLTNSTT